MTFCIRAAPLLRLKAKCWMPCQYAFSGPSASECMWRCGSSGRPCADAVDVVLRACRRSGRLQEVCGSLLGFRLGKTVSILRISRTKERVRSSVLECHGAHGLEWVVCTCKDWRRRLSECLSLVRPCACSGCRRLLRGIRVGGRGWFGNTPQVSLSCVWHDLGISVMRVELRDSHARRAELSLCMIAWTAALQHLSLRSVRPMCRNCLSRFPPARPDGFWARLDSLLRDRCAVIFQKPMAAN